MITPSLLFTLVSCMVKQADTITKEDKVKKMILRTNELQQGLNDKSCDFDCSNQTVYREGQRVTQKTCSITVKQDLSDTIQAGQTAAVIYCDETIHYSLIGSASEFYSGPNQIQVNEVTGARELIQRVCE